MGLAARFWRKKVIKTSAVKAMAAIRENAAR